MTKKETIKLSLLDLESESMELEEILSQSLSPNLKRYFFISFFEKLTAQKEQERFRSYYLQFESYIPSIASDIQNVFREPGFFIKLLKQIENFKSFVDSIEGKEKIEQAIEKVSISAALTFLYLGEPQKAAKLLNIKFDEKAIKIEVLSEIEKAKEFIAQAYGISDFKLKTITASIQKWEQNLKRFSPDCVNILMVEELKSSLQETHQGKLLTLSGTIRERPQDAEEDRVILNNQIRFNEGSIYWSLLDGVNAARQSLQQSGLPMNRYYSYQLSIPEKDPELYGNSIGAAAGLLAYSLTLNRYYRVLIVGNSKIAAITGDIQQNGGILPVNPQGIKAKLKTAFFSHLNRIYVPTEHLFEAIQLVSKLKTNYPNRYLTVEGIDSLPRAIQDRNLINREKITIVRKSIGTIKRVPRQYYISIVSGLALILILFLAIFSIFNSSRHSQPANFEIEGSELRIFNEDQKFLWSHDFNAKLRKESYNKNVILNDIDHDGKIDVLFGSYDNDDADFSGNVWRFDNKGNIVWKRHIGRKVYFRGEPYNDHFRIYQIYVCDLDHDGQNEIIQIAYHYPYFPECLQISDVNGKLISEYWHVGQTDVVTFIDIDNDGVDEILLGGQNNEYGEAVLAVLDYRLLQGCSPQTPGSNYFSDSLSSGTEKYYLRFPGTVFKKYGTRARDQIFSIQKRKNGFTVVVTNQYPNYNWSYPDPAGLVYYDLNEQMQLKSEPGFGDAYVSFLIDRFGIKSEDIKKDDYRKILYWDGDQWTEKATLNRRWKELMK